MIYSLEEIFSGRLHDELFEKYNPRVVCLSCMFDILSYRLKPSNLTRLALVMGDYSKK